MNRNLTGILILLLIGSASVGLADNRTLAGLPGVALAVEDLSEEGKKRTGLSEEQLQKEVETRLKASEIKILDSESTAEWNRDVGFPFLYVDVTLLPLSGRSSCVHHTRLAVRQQVVLERDNNVSTISETWSTSGFLAMSACDKTASKVKDMVGRMADDFVRAFTSVNPGE